MASSLQNSRGIVRGIHAGEIEYVDIWSAVLINGKFQVWQLVFRGELRCLHGVKSQAVTVDIGGM